MSRRTRLPALIALLAVVAVTILAGCTGSAKRASVTPTASSSAVSTPTASATSSATGSVPPAAEIAFSDCSQQFQAAIGSSIARQMQFSCGKLAVPVDYAKPAGATLDLFVVKVHYIKQQASQRLGSLLVNPGGPGASGINLAASLVTSLSSAIFDHFDLVGFDPRGVGLSSPLQCISDASKDALAAMDPDPRTAAGRAQAKNASAAANRGCVAKYGASLAHYNTEETARDMDRIRLAVGDPKLNYLGYSYGTRLGSVYAHLFPSTVRVAVLDGALDPVATDEVTTERQTKAFELAFDQFAANCVTQSACAPLGNPRAAVEALIPAADANPIRSSAQGETRRATGGIVTLAVVSALYDQSQWPTLRDALLAAKKGDAKGLFALADAYNERDPQTGHYSNITDANLAVNCNDSTTRFTDAQVAQAAASWVTKYPIFGRNAAASLYSCQGWPESGHPLPVATAPSAPKILVIGTVHDPATPYAAAATLAKTLGSGVVLSWDGEGHTAYPKTPCVTSKVNTYLIDDTLPADESCPASS